MSQIIVCFSEIFRGYVMFNSLKYFLELNLSINMPSFEHIPEIVLKEDYKKISDEELLNFVERNKQRLEFLLKGVEEDNLLIELKKHYMLFEFNELIPKIRLNALKTNKPYDLDDLKGLEVDNDGLVDIHDYLNYKSENQYMLCSPLRDIDSNYWLWKEIQAQAAPYLHRTHLLLRKRFWPVRIIHISLPYLWLYSHRLLQSCLRHR